MPSRTPSAPAPFAALRAAIHALPATREGFEGLVGALIGKATGERIRLISSGEQSGIDGVTDDGLATPRRAVQAKRYDARSHLAIAGLRVELDRAVLRFPALETWVLATTKSIKGLEADALNSHGQTLGVGVLVLDWDATAGSLPDLGVLAAAYPEVTETFLRRTKRAAWSDIAAIAGHPDFGVVRDRLIRDMASTGLGFGNAQAVAAERLESIFADPAAARNLAGPSSRFLSEAPPVARAAVQAEIEAWRRGGAGGAALLGNEGMGKTWSMLEALRSAASVETGSLPIVISSESAKRAPTGLDAVLHALVEAGNTQGLRLADATAFWRRRLELWARATGETDGPRVLVGVDGLDEAPDLDWARWIASLAEARWNGLFQVIVTCREESWTNALAQQLAGASTYQVIAIGRFTPAERDAYLAARGLDVTVLSPETAEIALHPRTAFHLTRMAGTLPDARRITREQLMLADFEHFVQVKGGAFNALQFETLVKELAVTARDAALSQSPLSVSEGDIASRARSISVAADQNLPRILSDLVSGSWCRRDPNAPSRITFEDHMLPAAIGMALADRLKSAGGDPVAEIERFLEPWAADDITERVLRMVAATLAIDASTSPALLTAVLRLWRQRPLRTDAASDAWRRLHPFRPDVFLDLCAAGPVEQGDWLCEWGVAGFWEDHPEHRDLIERRVFGWLTALPLVPRVDHSDPRYERYLNRGRRKQARAARAWAAFGNQGWSDLLGRETVAGAPDTALIALRTLSLLPLTPFVPALAGWSLVGSYAGRFKHSAAVADLVRFNPVDGEEADLALATAAEALALAGGRRDRRAGARLLQATGRPDHAARANVLEPAQATVSSVRSGLDIRAGVVRAWRGGTGHGQFLSALSQVAADPSLRLSAAVTRRLRRAIAQLSDDEVLAGLGGSHPDVDAALRWAPEAFLERARTAAVARALDSGDYDEAVTLLGVLTDGDLTALRAGAPPREDNGASSRWVTVNLAGRSFAQQRDFLLSTEDRAWPESFHHLLARPTPTRFERLLATIDFGQPWAENWRPVTLAIGLLETFRFRTIDPDINWRAAFGDAEPYAVKQALRLASRLKSPRAAEELVRRGWTASTAQDQGARFLGSDTHLALDDAALVRRLPDLEPDVWFRLYLDRPALRAALTPVIRGWLQAEMSHTGGRTFGGEHWSYGDEQEGYDAFCRDDPAWCIDLLRTTVADPARRRNLIWDHGEGAAWKLVKAVAPHDAQVAADIWAETVAETHGIRSSSVDQLPAELPAGARFDELRATMLDRASTDDELLDAVAALERNGHLGWLEARIRDGLAARRSAHRARAITMAGFLSGSPRSRVWETELAADPGPGWLAEVADAARSWRDRAVQARFWAGRLLETADEVEAWAADHLFNRVIDRRYHAWWGKPPYVRRRDWRSQWLNLDHSPRRQRVRDAQKDLGKTRFHTRSDNLGLPPRMNPPS